MAGQPIRVNLFMVVVQANAAYVGIAAAGCGGPVGVAVGWSTRIGRRE
jgi:hypothetical protein